MKFHRNEFLHVTSTQIQAQAVSTRAEAPGPPCAPQAPPAFPPRDPRPSWLLWCSLSSLHSVDLWYLAFFYLRSPVRFRHTVLRGFGTFILKGIPLCS